LTAGAQFKVKSKVNIKEAPEKGKHYTASVWPRDFMQDISPRRLSSACAGVVLRIVLEGNWVLL
jgi:hypothetical protein